MEVREEEWKAQKAEEQRIWEEAEKKRLEEKEWKVEEENQRL